MTTHRTDYKTPLAASPRTRGRALLFFLPCFLFARPAEGGAWTTPANRTELEIKRSTTQHRHLLSVGDVTVRAVELIVMDEIVISRGLSDSLAAFAELSDVRRRFGDTPAHDASVKAGLRIALPFEQIPLFPAFVAGLATRAYGEGTTSRQGKSSLSVHYGFSPTMSAHSYGGTLAMADRMAVGRVAALQEVTATGERLESTTRLSGTHKVMIGYDDAIWGGVESAFFKDSEGYHDVKYGMFVEMPVFRLPFVLKLAVGRVRTADSDDRGTTFMAGVRWSG